MLLAADWRATGGVLKIARCIWEVGVTGSSVIGRRRGVLNITGGLDCGLPLMAFSQQKANAKC